MNKTQSGGDEMMIIKLAEQDLKQNKTKKIKRREKLMQ